MKPSLYLETTIVSYYVARPTDKLIVAAHQELTRQWWEQRLKGFRDGRNIIHPHTTRSVVPQCGASRRITIRVGIVFRVRCLTSTLASLSA